MIFPRSSIWERLRFPGALLLLTVGLSACDFQGDPLVIEPEFDDVTSFETDLEKWTPRATDLGTPPATWEIVRSGDRATQGGGSSRLRLTNSTGQPRIFLERRYEVEKNQLYQVDLSFDFASADWAGAIPWRLLAGAAVNSPTQTGAVVTPADTGNGRAADEGYVWLQKIYSMDLSSDADGELFIYVGVSGATESARTYYVDNVKVTLTRKGISPPRP
jgi:hypothetical protein